MSFSVKVPFLKFQSRLSRYLCLTSFKSGRYVVCEWLGIHQRVLDVVITLTCPENETHYGVLQFGFCLN